MSAASCCGYPFAPYRAPSGRHGLPQMIAQPARERDDRQGRRDAVPGWKDRGARDEEVPGPEHAAVAVDHARCGRLAHACRAHVIGAVRGLVDRQVIAERELAEPGHGKPLAQLLDRRVE